eukprot:scaffold80180_cov32-Tisochrysis_lutea.AAC.1
MQTAMDAFLQRLQQEEEVEEEAALQGAGENGLASSSTPTLHIPAAAAAAAATADRDARHASCWPEPAAQMLMFTVMHDPSVRSDHIH